MLRWVTGRTAAVVLRRNIHPGLVKRGRAFSALSADSEDVRGLRRLLTDEESAILEEQRDLTEKARRLALQIEGVNVRSYSQSFLTDILPGTEDLSTFSICVAGEYNSGKSSLINALIGRQLLETGALPTTDSITVIMRGATDKNQHNVGGHGGVVLHQLSTVPLLQDLTLVDTPGTNAVILDHTQRTLRLLPTADLILFVTSADRPFPESERNLLKSIQAYRKNIVVVINKMDILETAGGNYGEEEKQRVINFVADNASELLGARPIVIPISARDAMSSKIAYKDHMNLRLWQRSNFASLESFLKDTLTTETKIRSKLASPVGLTEGMIDECLGVLNEQEEELETDIATLNLLKSQYGGWLKEVDAEIADFRKEIKSFFTHERDRSRSLLDSMSFVDRHLWPIESGRLEREWQKTAAVGTRDLEPAILEIVREIADLIATRARAQGQAVIEYLGKRPSMKSQSLVGSVTAASRFEDIRSNLEERLSTLAQKTARNEKLTRGSERYLTSIRQVSYLSMGIQVAALGTVSAAVLQAVDLLPGIVTSASLTTVSLVLISQGNKRALSQYCSVWETERAKLDEEVEAICSRELQKVHKRILEGVAPYTRYVETEQERIQSFLEDCQDILAAAQVLRGRINKLRHY